jgi:hypothetical protein
MEKTLKTLEEIDKHYRHTPWQPEVGKKLYLEVIVTNPDEARILMGWLYNSDKATELLGVSLQAIHWTGIRSNEDIKQALREFLRNINLDGQVI